MANKVKIGLVQAKVDEDLSKNLKKTGSMIETAAKKGASIVCLQELFSSRYFCQKEDKKAFSLAEKIPGKTSEFLSEQARKNRITLVGGSIFEKSDDVYYNTCLIFDKNGKEICKYRKVHIPYDPLYHEQFYFKPGNFGFMQAKVEGIKIAPLICYDQWFPEAARVNALSGAKIIFYPTAIGWFDFMKKTEPFSAQRWEDAMRSHASLNSVFVAAVNRVGKEGELKFWGGSFIADPYGQVIARASSDKEEVLVAEIDVDKTTEADEGWRFIRNRQPRNYGALQK